MTHGASQALSLALGAVANTGANVLLPKPGFPLYQTLCEYYGLEVRHYELRPERGWEADLRHVAALADARTAAIVVCNPSNPTGAVYSADHLRALLQVAAAAGAVVIADEVYADIVWGEGATFTPMARFLRLACALSRVADVATQAALSEDVPVLSVGALSKRWLVPGWCVSVCKSQIAPKSTPNSRRKRRRCGWLLVHDRHRALAGVGIVEALSRLVQITIGPTVPVQASVPHLLANTPRAWHDAMCGAYAAAAALCARRAAQAPGLSVEAPPRGAMYMLVTLAPRSFFGDAAADVADDVAWCAALQREEALLLLPGAAFGAPGCVRLVLCAPLPALAAAWDRIDAFAARHYSPAPKATAAAQATRLQPASANGH